jgi:hypothetical protein
MRDVQPGADPRDTGSLIRRIGAQPVIHRGDPELRPAGGSPVMQEVKQGKRIAATRDGNAQNGGRIRR